MKCEPIENYNDTLGAGDSPNTSSIAVQRGLMVIDPNPDEPVLAHSMWHKWKMSPEEMEHFKNTGELYIGFMGVTHPPMLVEVVHPESFANFTAFTEEEIENLKGQNKEPGESPETKD